MRTFTGLEELAAAVGEQLGQSDWHEITQQQVDLFADATGDHQWIHVDPERAKGGPFGRTIAHGYLTLSLLPVLAAEIYRVDGVQLGLNYGANKVRFPAPVPVGSRVRGSAQLLELTPIAVGTQAVVRMTVEIEGGAKPACVADVVWVYVP
ncbi:MaoC family dehydratase [Intrasporangium calvum]|uniref:Enoyl-CoA hydratase n=1 Tax=Intrasporangium calvum (strain ATCC 23552 / DSM 43043 / JCM 3097 / NBRC 12989 / NCIMB 10167 / NRRL B-3866 / 7 KIP) TaxID=710696 RepID=E6SD77_INTC7|nr:MaoC family dehydratase [Intrasporangium calvum]ADU49695.1 Enoyl-CoA hydratase [Intrasporangium calvum DSM 43043]